jgi:hypothetical protein
MTCDPPRLILAPPPRELGARMPWDDRLRLAMLVELYGQEAIRHALDDIEASRKARANG